MRHAQRLSVAVHSQSKCFLWTRHAGSSHAVENRFPGSAVPLSKHKARMSSHSRRKNMSAVPSNKNPAIITSCHSL